MIDDVSRTLRSILDDRAIETTCKELFDAAVRFDRPTEQFKPGASTVNLFLYDVRENTEMRNNQPLIERRNGKAVTRRPPLRVTCSYLVTAWPQGDKEDSPLEEQLLLSQTIQVLSSYPTIPIKFFPNDSPLRNQDPPLPMMITQMEGVKDPADFWSAIGGKLRPSFVVTITISLPIYEPQEPEGEPLVTGRSFDIGARTSPDEKGITPGTLSSTEIKNLFKVSGTVTGPDGAPVKDAVVTVEGSDLRATTDIDGSYALGLISKGKHTLRVKPGWKGSKLKSKDVIVDVSASAESFDVKMEE